MRAEIESQVKLINQSLVLLRRHLDWDKALTRLDHLNDQAESPDLWNDQAAAQKILKERESLQSSVNRIQSLEQSVQDSVELIELAEMEEDATVLAEAEKSLEQLTTYAARLQLETLLSGEADSNDAFIEINAGAGGTEAQDWAEMLGRMYSRWAEAHNYKLEILDENAGEEAGIKSITFKVIGHQAYGWLKTESGVHRLVRISPFDSNARRHTSFASVWVYPVIDDSIQVEVEEKDLRIDTYRASGAGGQHVNKTESAIRITHIPTNIVVQCQSDRSQHRNRAQAMSMLKARLYELELRKREEKLSSQAASKTDIGWGHQIRSYVLQPYQMVKDNRTGVERGNAAAVLDGDIDCYLEAALAQRIGGEEE
ncbi:MAG: peptide chain release factor 2 [Alphaproteobacteria bacterium]|nr:peptide chain release factor 2 [Alphaproteobacteria bacterium]